MYLGCCCGYVEVVWLELFVYLGFELVGFEVGIEVLVWVDGLMVVVFVVGDCVYV